MKHSSKSFLILSLFLCSLPLAAQDAPARGRLSPYGLAKPVLIVAGELPKDFVNKDDAPVLNTTKNTPPAGFQFLQESDKQPTAGKVGVYVPSGAVLSIKGRAVSNKGEGVVTLRLAKSANREARAIELSGKTSADYNELRRCAAERAAGSPWPPKKPGEPIVPKGTLVIVGGGGMTPEIAKAFIRGGGGEKGYFVALPISMPDPINTQAEEAFLRRLGAKNVTVIPYREQKDLEDPKTLEVLKKATGVWFGGGRQWNFMDGYEGTQLPALFNDVLARGGVIGGSSAGATIQGDYMVRGAPAGSTIMMCEGYERALGFLPGTAIDQHFSARKRFGDMTAFMKTYPQFLGIGLDEATAIVVQGSTAEILGKGKAYFYDRNKPLKEGRPDYEAFTAGTKYDLKERRVIK
jgi:cyanophycinase